MTKILGVDIGGVIIGHAAGVSRRQRKDTSFFGRNYLKTPQIEGAFAALGRLTDHFNGCVYLVSKAKQETQERTLHWLDHHDFYRRTGIVADHVEFCLERADKGGICRRLGITHFVDDKPELLSYLTTVPYRFLFQPKQQEVDLFPDVLLQVTRVESWAELEPLLLA